MKLTRKQLSLLVESYLKESQFLFEIKKKSFNQFIQRELINDQEFKTYIFNSEGGWIPPFNDPIMSKILFNTLSAGGQGHSVYDMSRMGEDILNKIVSNARRGDLPPRPVRGTANQFIDILPEIDVVQPDNTTLTYDKAIQYIESGTGVGKRSEALNKTIADGIRGQKSEFEVIAMPTSANPYFVAYPKTYKGSIALGRMGPDYNYLNPNSPNEKAQLGDMSWCTTVDGSGNMFLNYHQRMNLHMYYLTRVGDYDPRLPERKFCLSFQKTGDQVILHEDGHATVNGNNSQASKETIISHIGQRLYNLIEADAAKPSRKTIDVIAYFKSLTLDQYKDLREAVTSEQDLQLFQKQVEGICQYSSNVDIFIEMVKDPSPYIHRHPIRFTNSARPEVAEVAIEYLPFDKIIKSKLPLTPEFMTEVYRSEKKKNGGRIPSKILYNFIDDSNTHDLNSFYGIEIHRRDPSPEILDEMVKDITSDNVIYGSSGWSSENPPRDYYHRKIVRHPDLTSEHFKLLYQLFDSERSVDDGNKNLLVLITRPNCPEELKLLEITNRFDFKLRTVPAQGEAVANKLGELKSASPRPVSTLAAYGDSKLFKVFEEKRPDVFLSYIDAAAEFNSFLQFMSWTHLDPVYGIKVYERAIHREVLLNPNNYKNGVLSFRTEPSVVAPVILKLQKDPLIKKPDVQAYKKQVATTERIASATSLFVDPNNAVELQEYYQDEWMEALMPASEIGIGHAEIVKIYEKGYATVNIHDYMAEIIAYLQKYEEQPEMNNPETYGWALSLYKIVNFVINGKAAWQRYTQANNVPWPPKFNDFLI